MPNELLAVARQTLPQQPSRMLGLLVVLLLSSMLFTACGGGGSSSSSSGNTNITPSKTSLGAAQKGPFMPGSQVTITPLNSQADAVGEPLKTQVDQATGSFSIETQQLEKLTEPLFHLSASGKTFDEATGGNTAEKLELKSITDDLENGSVNVFTHWHATRVEELFTGATSSKQAIQQATAEIEEIFGVNSPGSLDYSQTGSNSASESATLLLVSGALMEVAAKHQTSADTIIDDISQDFADDGKLTGLGENWLDRMQAVVRDDAVADVNQYAKNLNKGLQISSVTGSELPQLIKLASRPTAILPEVIYASPGETITLNGSESHDSGDIINFTWFRVDQQSQFNVPVSDRFVDSPSITVPNQECELLFALVVTDADKLTDTAVIKVIVREPEPENQPPTANPQVDDQQVVTNEDTPVNISLTGSDPDGDTLNFIITTPLLLPNGILEGTAPNLVYTPTQNFTGTDSFTFQVDDGMATSNTARVDILVLPVNDPPVADDKTVVTDEDTPVNISLTGSDIENDPLTFSIGAKTPDNGSLGGAPPNVVYTPGLNFFGNDSFDYLANDGMDDSQPATVNIIVNPVNDPPIANPQSVTTNEDTPVGITLTGSDIEGDPLSFNLGGISVQNGTLTGTPPNLTYTPNPDFNGSDSFDFTVNDGTDTSASALVNITVLPVDDNTPPVAEAGDPQTVVEGLTVALNGSGTDAEDGTNVAYQWTAPSGISLSNPNSPNPTFTAPDVDDTQVFTFSLIVRDTEGLPSAPDTVNITVEAVVLPPDANAGPDQTLAFPGEVLEINLDGSGSSDPNGSDLSYSWVVVSSSPYSSINIYEDDNYGPDDENTPVALFNVSSAPGTVTLELTVTNTDGLSDSDQVIITIQLPPTAEDQSVNVYDYYGTFITLEGNDPDGDNNNLTYEITRLPENGQLTGITGPVPVVLSSNQVEYIPNNDPPVTDYFEFSVRDEQGWYSSSATVDLIPPLLSNLPPISIANAGPVGGPYEDPHVPFFNGESSDLIQLDGTLSYDPDNSATPTPPCSGLQYSWSKLAPTGSSINLQNANTARPDPFSLSGVAIWIFQLTVTDCEGATHSDTVEVRIE